MAFIDRLMGPPTGSRSTGPPRITYKNFTARIVQYNPPESRRLTRTKVYYDVIWEDAGKQYIHEVRKEYPLFRTLHSLPGFESGGQYQCYHVDQAIPENHKHNNRIRVDLPVWVCGACL